MSDETGYEYLEKKPDKDGDNYNEDLRMPPVLEVIGYLFVIAITLIAVADIGMILFLFVRESINFIFGTHYGQWGW